MKMKINRTLLAAVFLIFSMQHVSCKKDINKYKNDPGVYFYELQPNTTILNTSQSYSFATKATSLTKDTIFVNVKIMGLASVNDRTFSAEVIKDGTTAIEGTNYKLLNGVIKANQITGKLPVVVYRTAELKNTTLKLNIRIANSSDFKAGVSENNYFSLSWNDTLIKPANWDAFFSLAQYFGAYSTVKYQFIIDVLKRADFPLQIGREYIPGTLTNQQMLEYLRLLKAALLNYNNTHTNPLTDEFGTVITFPN